MKAPAGSEARVIDSGAMDAAMAMAWDEALLSARAPDPVLRFYQWRLPAISLGFSQPWNKAQDHLRRDPDLALVRRVTGGGAIVHREELTYSVVVPLPWPSLPSGIVAGYYHLTRPWVTALGECGVDAAFRCAPDDCRAPWAPGATDEAKFLCFERRTGFDVVVKGRKLLGSAQRRTKEALLQHGSLVLTARGRENDVTGLGEWVADSGKAVAFLKRRVPDLLGAALGVRFAPGEATMLERREAERLCVSKYQDEAWTKAR